MTIKDLIFHTVVILWLMIGIISGVFYGGVGIIITHLVFITLFGSLVLFKLLNKKFGLWLEKPLKKIQ